MRRFACFSPAYARAFSNYIAQAVACLHAYEGANFCCGRNSISSARNRNIRLQSRRLASFSSKDRCRRGHKLVAAAEFANIEKQLFGEDFGARDPTAGEIESNFCEKVLGNWDTEHIIKAPDSIGKYVGLAAKSCSAELSVPLDEKARERLRQQVPGWKVVTSEDRLRIRHDWTAQDPGKAEELKSRVEAVAAEEGRDVIVTAVASSVFTVLPSEGELSANDFIVAAKINSLDLSDVLKAKRAKFWA